MSWLDNVSMKWTAPYDAFALAKYRQLYAIVPPQVQAPLDVAEEWYTYLMATQDPRVKDWPLMNPFHNLFLIICYLTTIFVLTNIMKRVSKPFPTKYLALWHNVFCTALSLYMCVEIWHQAWINRYHVLSESIDRTPNGLPIASVLWVFYASKVPEFFDTVLMALKRNFRQITFLHVYHHSSIFVIWWFIMSYVPGGSSYFSAALNSFVHVVMYGYYLWASLAPKPVEGVRPRWNQPAFYRRYITSFQLIQFCCNFFQSIYMIWINPPKDFAMFTVWILFFYMISMLVLFGNFYLKAYGGGKKTAKVDAIQNGKVQKKEQ